MKQLETIRFNFGKYKGKQLKEVPDSYLKYMLEEGILNGKIKLYAQHKLNVPKGKYKVSVSGSVGQDGEYEIEAYNGDEAINNCIRKYNIQSTQSFHGTEYSVKSIES